MPVLSDSIYKNTFCYLCVCAAVCLRAPVLKPLVEVLSDPDSINRMLLSQLEQREQQAEQQKKAYTYAASYEDFVKLISTSADVNFLKQLRQDMYTPALHHSTETKPLHMDIPQMNHTMCIYRQTC